MNVKNTVSGGGPGLGCCLLPVSVTSSVTMSSTPPLWTPPPHPILHSNPRTRSGRNIFHVGSRGFLGELRVFLQNTVFDKNLGS